MLSTMPEWFAALICARLGMVPIRTGARQASTAILSRTPITSLGQCSPVLRPFQLSSLHVWTRLSPDGSHWAADFLVLPVVGDWDQTKAHVIKLKWLAPSHIPQSAGRVICAFLLSGELLSLLNLPCISVSV